MAASSAAESLTLFEKLTGEIPTETEVCDTEGGGANPSPFIIEEKL